MTPDPTTTTTSTPAAQASPASAAAAGSAPGPQPAPAAPAAPPSPTPVQLLWDVATLAFELLTRLVHVIQPLQARFPKQSWQVARLLIDLPRIFLTIRYAPERVTAAQLRHLTRARHILQALFGYTLGARTPSSASAPVNQSPSVSTKNATPPGARKPSSATTPTPAIHAVPEVPSVPAAASPDIPSAASSHAASSSTLDPSHSSQIPQSKGEDPVGLRDHNPQSSFAPYIPDFHTLAQALKATSLPANCAGALFDDPGDALVRALQQLHAVYFSLYPNQPPSPTQSHSPSPSPSQSQSISSCNPQSDAPSVHSVHSPSPVQSEIPNPQSAICNLQSDIPHSTAPP